MSITVYPYDGVESSENLKKLASAEYIVYATNTEQHGIWYNYVHHQKLIAKWEQDVGFSHVIGEVAGYPINASVYFVTIDGLLVAFVDCVSQIAHYPMLEEWVEHYNKAEHNGRQASTNAGNFHNVYHAIIDKREGKSTT